mmetsp:Transcript_16501/g.40855  ORF Transcript_16501/g.40855 Transcript_16501/m.40855 type:complete len:652 (+) Transcript_16501:367-2322(+)|eukprot:CAMPEP_0178995282 /NCGR_PEP_ID=MMETSP0795-20121207/7749_1 /TAXON_ID=88552 /ORGANISM="Amoebophrya sp., Strain Ameob2" /LENGTH=651 /DNA_ID=CAMNT_0020687589 /DNA_START=363 /DNA_END=2318 /DNA_ORIENTATION=-
MVNPRLESMTKNQFVGGGGERNQRAAVTPREKMKQKQEMHELRKKTPLEREVPASDTYPMPIQQLRAQIYFLFEIPEASILSRIVQVLILLCIACSVTTFVWESFPDSSSLSEVFGVLEWVFTGIFTAEFTLRFWVCNVFETYTRREFLKDSLNLMDLCAIMPAYLELAFSSVFDVSVLRVFRVVRLIRLFRLMRLGPFQVGVLLIYQTVQRAVKTLLVLFFILAIVVVFFGTLIYYTERWYCPKGLIKDYATEYDTGTGGYTDECRKLTQGFTARSLLEHADKLCCVVFNTAATDDKEKTYAAKGFESIMHSLWWSLVTVSTVGYGDYTPQTDVGKYVGMAVMICGILILSLPVGIVGSKFHDAYNELDREPPTLRYFTRTLKYKEAKEARQAEVDRCKEIRRAVLNEEATGVKVERDDLFDLPLLDDERQGASQTLEENLRKLLSKLKEEFDADEQYEEERRKGRHGASAAARKHGGNGKGTNKQGANRAGAAKKNMFIPDMVIEQERKEMKERLDLQTENMLKLLQTGVVPKELLFPKVGCAGENTRKQKEDVLSALIQKAEDMNKKNRGGALGALRNKAQSSSMLILTDPPKEYPLKDFEVLVCNINACLQYQRWLDERHELMLKVRSEMDQNLVSTFGQLLGEDNW